MMLREMCVESRAGRSATLFCSVGCPTNGELNCQSSATVDKSVHDTFARGNALLRGICAGAATNRLIFRTAYFCGRCNTCTGRIAPLLFAYEDNLKKSPHMATYDLTFYCCVRSFAYCCISDASNPRIASRHRVSTNIHFGIRDHRLCPIASRRC